MSGLILSGFAATLGGGALTGPKVPLILRNLIGVGLATAPVTVPIVTDIIENMTPGRAATLSRAGSLGVSTISKLGESGFVGTLANGVKISAGFEKIGSTLGVNISYIESAVRGTFNFGKLESNAVNLAKSEGVSTLVIRAVNVINDKVAQFLTKAGYSAEKVVDKFGRETVNYVKTIKVGQ